MVQAEIIDCRATRLHRDSNSVAAKSRALPPNHIFLFVIITSKSLLDDVATLSPTQLQWGKPVMHVDE